MLACLRELAVLIKRVGEIDLAHRIGGMAGGGFRVSGAGGGSIAGSMQERAKIVESDAVRGRARQDVEISVACVQCAAQFDQQIGTLEPGFHGVRLSCDAGFDITQGIFAGYARRPVG